MGKGQRESDPPSAATPGSQRKGSADPSTDFAGLPTGSVDTALAVPAKRVFVRYPQEATPEPLAAPWTWSLLLDRDVIDVEPPASGILLSEGMGRRLGKKLRSRVSRCQHSAAPLISSCPLTSGRRSRTVPVSVMVLEAALPFATSGARICPRYACSNVLAVETLAQKKLGTRGLANKGPFENVRPRSRCAETKHGPAVREGQGPVAPKTALKKLSFPVRIGQRFCIVRAEPNRSPSHRTIRPGGGFQHKSLKPKRMCHAAKLVLPRARPDAPPGVDARIAHPGFPRRDWTGA